MHIAILLIPHQSKEYCLAIIPALIRYYLRQPYHKKKIRKCLSALPYNHMHLPVYFEPKTGLEPVTYALRMRCSTN